jgi:hypothetical protein
MDLASIARRIVRARQPSVTAPAPTPERYRPLLGSYVRPDLGGWVVRLEWRDGKLTFVTPESPAWRMILAPTDDPDLFAVEPEPGPPGESVTFRRRPDGRVTSAFLMDTTWVRLDGVAAAETA